MGHQVDVGQEHAGGGPGLLGDRTVQGLTPFVPGQALGEQLVGLLEPTVLDAAHGQGHQGISEDGVRRGLGPAPFLVQHALQHRGLEGFRLAQEHGAELTFHPGPVGLAPILQQGGPGLDVLADLGRPSGHLGDGGQGAQQTQSRGRLLTTRGVESGSGGLSGPDRVFGIGGLVGLVQPAASRVRLIDRLQRSRSSEHGLQPRCQILRQRRALVLPWSRGVLR